MSASATQGGHKKTCRSLFVYVCAEEHDGTFGFIRYKIQNNIALIRTTSIMPYEFLSIVIKKWEAKENNRLLSARHVCFCLQQSLM